MNYHFNHIYIVTHVSRKMNLTHSLSHIFLKDYFKGDLPYLTNVSLLEIYILKCRRLSYLTSNILQNATLGTGGDILISPSSFCQNKVLNIRYSLQLVFSSFKHIQSKSCRRLFDNIVGPNTEIHNLFCRKLHHLAGELPQYLLMIILEEIHLISLTFLPQISIFWTEEYLISPCNLLWNLDLVLEKISWSFRPISSRMTLLKSEGESLHLAILSLLHIIKDYFGGDWPYPADLSLPEIYILICRWLSESHHTIFFFIF